MYIHKKELQNNPILICIVFFLDGPQGPASLWKPWDRLWTWMLGQHTGCFTTSFDIYIRHSQANLQLGLSDCQQITCTYINNTLMSTMHLYLQPIIIQANTVGFIIPSTNHLHLYQQYTYINNALISTTNHQPSQYTIGFIRLQEIKPTL